MALGNTANPIIKDSEPRLSVSPFGTIVQTTDGSKETSLSGVYTGGDAARGGSTAIRAAGDGQSAAREIVRRVGRIPTRPRPRIGSPGHWPTPRPQPSCR